ncbi:AAA family ATPase [Pseudomonas aeruginosa]|uniref:AAA family ATPase n=3 Tax=Gammaproteobacteria TaxID=1236 RepID=UPI000939AC57|nr:AAA family ATPase [Pseudomonas aeruginosa]MBG4133862.1 AAA family ATPase [Pseudomonas aeruginosa]MBG4270841.1 AAA family ATPase [Pseudomonas aeruginosa]MBG5739590.1 AAA family ATPase [Pseudomonas aeruginosa]MBG6941956.1 AAA family ATPase [Pseudomonas aeruginosa]
MINGITIKDVASYDRAGISFIEMAKVNFIYGANGSGKTTISNFLDGASLDRYKSCSISWDAGGALDVLVYNKGFRERNFGRSTIEGVFTLGEAAIDIQEKVEEKQKLLQAIVDDGKGKKATLEKLKGDLVQAEEAFREKVWAAYYKVYEDEFKPAFRGNAQKESFKQRLIMECSSSAPLDVSLDQMRDLARTVFGVSPKTIEPLVLFPVFHFERFHVDSVWREKVIGKDDVDIAELINRLGISDWVSFGRGFVEGETCPFCQKSTITAEFKEKLDLYFDDSYKKGIQRLNKAVEDYKAEVGRVKSFLSRIEEEVSRRDELKFDVDSYKAECRAIFALVDSNLEIVYGKLKEPSRTVELHSMQESFDKIALLFMESLRKVDEHNRIVDNLRQERNKLVNSLWRYLAHQAQDDFKEYSRKIAGIKKGIENVERIIGEKRLEYKALEGQVRELVANSAGVQPAVEEINRLLLGCGFNSFQIVPADSVANHYQIKREDGSLAEPTLSEGEVSFITFLYFLQLAKGGTRLEKVRGARVLVVDDPISSLDSGILFVVSTLMKGVIREIKAGVGDIKQLILLTHNVYFHKEVSFIDGRTRIDADVKFWIIRKNDRFSKIFCYGMDNPISTSYELLWRELREVADDAHVTIQNVMRRIIENYFKILGSYGDDELIGSFATKEDKDICRSLLSWVNDGSHCVSDDLFIQSEGVELSAYKRVFKEIFIRTKHEAHYEMMMRV